MKVIKENADISNNLYDRFFEGKNFSPFKTMKYILSLCDLINIPKMGFFQWDNKHWQLIEEEQIVNIIHNEMGCYSRPEYHQSTIKIIAAERYIELEKINQNRNRIVCQNGTLDLSNWMNPVFYENQFFRDDFCTIQLNCNYNPESAYPMFEKYLNDVFEGNLELINIIAEMFGYSLTTSTKHEKIFILHGVGGSGKSVLIDTIKTLLTNQSYSAIPMSLLEQSFLRSRLKDKLINISTEEGKGIIDNVGWIKAISSGDIVEGQFKHKDSFEFKPFCKLIYAMNDIPQIKNIDYAIKRRFLIIPFNKVFSDEEKDLNFKEGKLHVELDGILNFAIAGLKRLAEQKSFTYSQKCEDALKRYALDCSTAERFLEDCVIKSDTEKISSKEIYLYYCEFCKVINEKPFRDVDFYKVITSKFGCIKKKIRIKGILEYGFDGINLIKDGIEFEEGNNAAEKTLRSLELAMTLKQNSVIKRVK